MGDTLHLALNWLHAGLAWRDNAVWGILSSGTGKGLWGHEDFTVGFGIHRSECVVGALVEKGMLQEPEAMVGKGRGGGSIPSATHRVTGFAVGKGGSW